MNTNTTDNESKVDVLLLLDNGCTVSKKLFDEIFDQVTDEDLPLYPDAEYALQMLCEPHYWSSLSMGQRRSAGMCMAQMVRKRQILYVPTGRPCQSPKVYSII